jgi:hypothetical protein
MQIPFTRIKSYDITTMIRFKPHQTVFVNCCSSFPQNAAYDLQAFVKEGGLLVTTDWALNHVLEVAFKGHFKWHNSQSTGDEAVPVTEVDKDDYLVRGLLGQDAYWHLAGGAHPFDVISKEAKVLVKSNVMKSKYGADAIIAKVAYGKGTVYHMVSHFYSQSAVNGSVQGAQNATGQLVQSSILSDVTSKLMKENTNSFAVRSR